MLDTSSYGVKDYRIEIESAFDTENKNNVTYFSQYVAKEPRILIVGGTPSDVSATTPLYDYGRVDSVLAKDCKNSAEYLGGYDIIVLSGVDLRSIPSAQIFADNLQKVVADYGKSLMIYGGENTYGEGSFLGSYTKMLPVNFDVSKSSTAIILVIDSSLSMRTDNRIDLAKKGAINCLDLLGDDDYISVITFDGTVNIVVPLMRVIDRDDVEAKINSIEMDRATMMTAGLKAAYDQIKGLNFDSKQVLLISDGMPGDRGQEEVVQDLLAENVTTSVINIASSQGVSFLKNLSTLGNGNYYYINSPTSLPDIMLNEVNNDIGITKIEQLMDPIIRKPNDSSLVGIEVVPQIGSMNYSISKYAATTVLTCKFQDDNDVTKEAPLYLYWDYGLGKVSLFNSGLAESWSKEWLKQPEAKQFMANIISAEMPTVRYEQSYSLDLVEQGMFSRLEVLPEAPSRSGKMSAVVTSPSGEKFEVDLSLANNIYTGLVETVEEGYYTVELTYNTEGVTSVNRFYKAFSYSREYRTFDLGNEYLLYNCTLGEGVMTDDLTSIGLDWREMGTKEVSYVLPFLLISILLFIVDIVIRKLKWSDILYLFEKKNKEEEETK